MLKKINIATKEAVTAAVMIANCFTPDFESLFSIHINLHVILFETRPSSVYRGQHAIISCRRIFVICITKMYTFLLNIHL